jgi:hypothetical protein
LDKPFGGAAGEWAFLFACPACPDSSVRRLSRAPVEHVPVTSQQGSCRDEVIAMPVTANADHTVPPYGENHSPAMVGSA